MNHSAVNARMAEYLEGDLALGKRALFDAHIDRCASCRKEFIELRETIALLRSLPDPEPPPFLVENVMRRIRAGEAETRLSDRLRDWLAALATPRVAVPATALLVGLLMASGTLDPAQVQLPELLSSRKTVRSEPSAVRLPGESVAVAEVARFAVEEVARSKNSGAGESSFDVGVDPERTRRVAAERDLSLAAKSATLPPVVGRAPRITIQIPVRGGTLQPGQLVTSLPTLSTPGRGIPYSEQVNAPLERPASGVMQAGTSDLASLRTADFVGASDDSKRHQRKRAELVAQLDRLIRNPIVYSVEFAELDVTEQEIWLDALAEHATAVSRGEEAVSRLRRADDPRAQELATALATQLRLALAAEREEIASVAGER